MPFINCEVSLTLTWSENCVLTDITTQTARAPQGDNPARPAIVLQQVICASCYFINKK